jgi:prophage maintenance system killer protein
VIFVELIVVHATHELALEREGGAQGIRDLNVLESAVKRAQMRFTYSPLSTIAQLAAALLTALCAITLLSMETNEPHTWSLKLFAT